MEYLELNPQSDLPNSSSFDEKLKDGNDSESDIEILDEIPYTPVQEKVAPKLSVQISPIQAQNLSPSISVRERDVSNNSETKSNDSGYGHGEEIIMKNNISRFVQFP